VLAERIERQFVLLAAVSARGLLVSSGFEFAFDWYYRSSASPRTTKHVAPGLLSAMHPRLVLLCVVGTGVWLAQGERAEPSHGNQLGQTQFCVTASEIPATTTLVA
jgi:hypothetical protein